MIREFLLTVGTGFLMAQVSSAEQLTAKAVHVDFAAPSYFGKDHVEFDLPVGAIILDTEDNTFWGRLPGDGAADKWAQMGTTAVIESGVYTPTLSDGLGSKLTGITHQNSYYQRIGDIVTVHGTAGVSTSDLTRHILLITLPIASNFTTGYEASGTCAVVTGNNSANDASRGGIFLADPSADKASCLVNPSASSAATMSWSFQYKIQ